MALFATFYVAIILIHVLLWTLQKPAIRYTKVYIKYMNLMTIKISDFDKISVILYKISKELWTPCRLINGVLD